SVGDSSGQVLHHSVLPTSFYQEALPRLPIPRLEDSIRRYLAAQRPLLEDDQLRQTATLAEAFLKGEGRELHRELVALDKRSRHTSYISEAFLDKYLCARDSLVKSNAFIVFASDRRREYNEQLVRATNLLCSAARFMKTLRAGLLEPDVFHLNPSKSDTARFKRLIRWVPSSLSWYGAYLKGRHVLVMRRGNMYVFDLLDRDGNMLRPTEILAHLQYILADPAPEASFPLGFLTAENRDVWAHLRTQLVAAGNAEEVHSVDSALFCLCLDDQTLTDLTHVTQSVFNGAASNRWYDKSFSLILTQNGQGGINFEHSWGDGISVLRFVNEISRDTSEQPLVHPGSAAAAVDSASAVHKLLFKLDSELENGISRARERAQLLSSDLTVDVRDIKTRGRKFLKQSHVSPDAIMQLAFQMAFLRQHGRTVVASESCSTAAFKHGRFEDMRSVTTHTKRCSQAFVCQPGQHSAGQLKAMLQECSRHHRQLTKEAATGQGFGCHLHGLQQLALARGQPLPGLYADPAYSNINHIVLSSSTLSSSVLRTGGAAPVVPDGLGLGYGFREDGTRSIVTGYPAVNVCDFQECVFKSLKDIYAVLEGKPI
ncbi:unnamed protein product, partial [Tetraodon nigroviridis]